MNIFRILISLVVVSLIIASAGCTKRPPGTSKDTTSATTQAQTADRLDGTIKLSWSLDRTWTDPPFPEEYDQHLQATASYHVREPRRHEPGKGLGGTYAATAFVHGNDNFTVKRANDLCGDGSMRKGEYFGEGYAFLDGGGDGQIELQLTSLRDDGVVRDDQSIVVSGGAGKVPVLLGEHRGRTTLCGKETAGGSMPIEQVILAAIPQLVVPRSGPGHWHLERNADVDLYAVDEIGTRWYGALAPAADYTHAKVTIDLWQPDPKCTSEPVQSDPLAERARKFALLQRANTTAQRSPPYKSAEEQLGDRWEITVSDAPFEEPTDPATQAATYATADGGARTAFPESNGFTLRDEFQAAVTLAHEQQHALDIIASGGQEKLATVTTADEFVALAWELDARAFRAEDAFLQGLVAQDPSYTRCRDELVASQENRGSSEAEKDKWLTRHYRESEIRDTWEKSHANPPDAKAQKFVDSLNIGEILQHWTPYF